jgi:hypothetical protein
MAGNINHLGKGETPDIGEIEFKIICYVVSMKVALDHAGSGDRYCMSWPITVGMQHQILF